MVQVRLKIKWKIRYCPQKKRTIARMTYLVIVRVRKCKVKSARVVKPSDRNVHVGRWQFTWYTPIFGLRHVDRGWSTVKLVQNCPTKMRQSDTILSVRSSPSESRWQVLWHRFIFKFLLVFWGPFVLNFDGSQTAMVSLRRKRQKCLVNSLEVA